jgi:hypothetical protein
MVGYASTESKLKVFMNAIILAWVSVEPFPLLEGILDEQFYSAAGEQENS